MELLLIQASTETIPLRQVLGKKFLPRVKSKKAIPVNLHVYVQSQLLYGTSHRYSFQYHTFYKQSKKV